MEMAVTGSVLSILRGSFTMLNRNMKETRRRLRCRSSVGPRKTLRLRAWEQAIARRAPYLQRAGFTMALLALMLVVGFISRAQAQDAKPVQPADVPVGRVTMEQVYQLNEEYKPRAEAYVPIASGVEFLKTYPKKIRIEVFYGTWCGDSRSHVPSFLKVMAMTNNPNIEISLWAVDRTKKEPADLVTSRRIVRVPTFIVYDDERELGRIVETPATTIEEDLFRILEPTTRK